MFKYIFLVYLIIPFLAFGYDADRARANIAHEFAECAAYYRLIANIPNLEIETKKKLENTSTDLVLLSAQLTSEKLALARVELTIKAMGREMERNWENLSIINNKYRYLCENLIQDPEARIRYWLEKN